MTIFEPRPLKNLTIDWEDGLISGADPYGLMPQGDPVGQPEPEPEPEPTKDDEDDSGTAES